ncbi:MAG: thioesterase family protein [Pseudomonadota bacterium]|nr:thioesterase family protein [Pseudomonadota bacterium]
MITTAVQTRGYELDASRTIPPAILLRYMEWGRWEFFNSKKIVLHQSINSVVVATQSLAVLAPVQERVDLQINAWLSRVGNTSMDISQLVVDQATGQPVAMGRAILVNVGEDGRPFPVADATRTQVEQAPEGFDEARFPRIESRQSPADARSLPRRVMASEIDLLQHVNHSRYVDYVEDARKLLFEAQSSVAESIRGLTVEYVTEALHGDELIIKSWPVAEGKQIQSQIVRGDQVIANAIVER